MRHRRAQSRFSAAATTWIVLTALLLTGCQVRLAPEFDQTIVDGLTSANQKTLVHFASVSSGSDQNEFQRHEATYNELIGQFDALRLQAEARPEPSTPSFLSALSDTVPQLEEISKLETPTPEILSGIVGTMTRMRDDHRDKGLTPGSVELFKGSFEIKMDQALTYEKALQR